MKMRKYKKLWILACFVLFSGTMTYAALTVNPEALQDWKAVPQNSVTITPVISCSGNYLTIIHLQAFLDTATAHTGTGFLVQTSSQDSGNEDWQDFGGQFEGLVGTANSEAIIANPAVVGTQTFTVADTGGLYEAEPLGQWIAIEDGTLINSELVFQTGFTADATITILDGTTNQHAQNTLFWDIALTRNIILPLGTNRARLVINNTVDVNGSSLNFKASVIEVTGL